MVLSSGGVRQCVWREQRADERVKGLLSEDQYRKLKSGGYGAALGIGGPSMAVTYTSFSSSEDDGK